MGEAYWVAGGVATEAELVHALAEAGLRSAWMEESHVWGVPPAQALPGLMYAWPFLPAPSALRWLQSQVAALRHGEREWLLLVQSEEGKPLVWSALASAGGVGRYNVLPRARLRDLPPWQFQASPQAWRDWLAEGGVEAAHLRYLVVLGAPPALPGEEEMALTRLSVPWPGDSLPAVLTQWGERVEHETPAVALVLSQVGGAMVAVSLEAV